MPPVAGRLDLAFNYRGRVSPSQWLLIVRRTVYQPVAVLIPVLFLAWWVPTIIGGGRIPLMSFGMGVILATVVFALAAGWYLPLFLDLVIGNVRALEGDLKKSKTAGLFGDDWYVMVEGTAFSMSRADRDRLPPGRYRAYVLPRTRRLVALEQVEPEVPWRSTEGRIGGPR